ncbi:hypothetical protein PAP_07420 [Palaeococcus pacificus DY20341]|uniref:Uncharacterized protein n=1 Tax=Palaeococcus pacificus DY20341 TaxID=1343739 RepID=A0A075LU22_9EURY|nr:hypothetical protein [Palaeococcus pacificus]AIF69874.1 hypothetical protein PAP_07420 [Palaeococcus pacificus DY20341]
MINYIPLWNSIVALMYIVLIIEIALKTRPSAGELIFMTLYSISALVVSWISLGYSLLLLAPLLMYGMLAYSENESLGHLKEKIKALEGEL